MRESGLPGDGSKARNLSKAVSQLLLAGLPKALLQTSLSIDSGLIGLETVFIREAKVATMKPKMDNGSLMVLPTQ